MPNNTLTGNRTSSNFIPSVMYGVDVAPIKKLYSISLVDVLDSKNDGIWENCLAIIGARRCTVYGRKHAYKFAKIAAEKGVRVITGGARGIDTAAIDGALEGGLAPFVIVAGGLDNIYPPENAPLFQKVIDNGGAILSEEKWDDKPLPWMFRARNRIIAAAAKATFVIEAGVPSGSMATVEYARSCDREVWALPGNIDSEMSMGCNNIIAMGATSILNEEGFCDELFGLFGELTQKELPR